jgi:signal transduction histidine kinase
VFNTDTILARRALPAVWVYPIFLGTIYLSSDYATRHPYILEAVAALTLVLSALRYYLGHRILRQEAPARAIRRGLKAVILATALLWGSFLVVTIALWGYQAWPTLLLMVCMSASAAGSVPSNASDLRLSTCYLILLLGPSLVRHAMMGGREGAAMAILFTLYLLYLLSQAQSEYRAILRAKKDTHLLEVRAEELGKAKERAEEASRAKSAFLANMTHELRTPLNAIIGYSEMLIEEVEAVGHREFVSDLERIRNAGRHQLTLVSDILDISKIEAGRREIRKEAFDVAAVVLEMVGSVEPMARQNRNRLVRPKDLDLGWMESDLTMVRQILYNLLGNACKFTQDGTVSMHARRISAGSAEAIEFRVEDSGIGMSERTLSQLFQPFTQADSSITRLYGGTGLGLALTKRYTEMLGGSISVDSKAGQGSCFTVVVPAGHASPPETADSGLTPLAEALSAGENWNSALPTVEHNPAMNAVRGRE